MRRSSTSCLDGPKTVPSVTSLALRSARRDYTLSKREALWLGIEGDELPEAKLEKNLSTLFTTETRSTRRSTENPNASVKSPYPPCLRGETGHVAAAGSLSESQRRNERT